MLYILQPANTANTIHTLSDTHSNLWTRYHYKSTYQQVFFRRLKETREVGENPTGEHLRA